jgi:hypothetical protein
MAEKDKKETKYLHIPENLPKSDTQNTIPLEQIPDTEMKELKQAEESLRLAKIEKETHELNEETLRIKGLIVKPEEAQAIHKLDADLKIREQKLAEQTKILNEGQNTLNKTLQDYKLKCEIAMAKMKEQCDLKLTDSENTYSVRQKELAHKEAQLIIYDNELQDREDLILKHESYYNELIENEVNKITSEAIKIVYKIRMDEYQRKNFLLKMFTNPPEPLNPPLYVNCPECNTEIEI